MKLYPIAILLLCAFQANAQGWKAKVFGNKNQLEIGSNWTAYPSSSFEDNKNSLSKYRTDPYYRNNNYFIGYTRFLRKEITLSVDLTKGFNGNIKDPANVGIGEIRGAYYSLLNIGVGKRFYFMKFELNPKLYLSYRYDGYQYTIFGYRNPNGILTEPLYADLKYNSPGGAIGVDVSYFLGKHVGLGIKTSYHFYPFEDAKLSSGSAIDKPDPALVQSHRPLNQLFLINLKLIARL